MQKTKTAERFLSIFCWIGETVGAFAMALKVQTGDIIYRQIDVIIGAKKKAR
jgi:hypothetical protein